jgi:hypothetical protein
VYLPENQVKILFYIALIGPIDAYRANRELNFSLSTTQLAFKKMKDVGFIQLKEIVKGDTEQNRKIYCLAPLGFCVVTATMLKTNAITTYDQLKKHIELNSNLFPDLLEKWDFFVGNSRKYYSKNPVKDWQRSMMLISFPDISTEIWGKILNSICIALIKKHDCTEKIISLSDISEEFRQSLINFIYKDMPLSQNEGLVFALKQDKKLWNELVPSLLSQLDYYKEKQVKLEKILNNKVK